MPARQDEPKRDAATVRHRAPVLLAAVATLLVIVVPYATSGGPREVGPPSQRELLPLQAQRVLEEFPEAFETAGVVVVPADLDPGVAWTGAVGEERIDGEVVDLGAHGLVDYGYLPSSGNVASWATGLDASARVLSDTGPLAFACTRWPGASSCSGSLLARVEGRHYIVRSGLDVPHVPDQVLRFSVLDLGEPAALTLGVAPPGVVHVELEGSGGRVAARMSEQDAVAGRTLWWSVSDEAPQVLESFDATGALVERVDLGG